MPIDQLTAILGWAAVVCIGVLLPSIVAQLVLRGPITHIHARLVGLNEQDLGRAYFQLLTLVPQARVYTREDRCLRRG
jgi:hypothetical protein